jgi:hypothetical protein
MILYPIAPVARAAVATIAADICPACDLGGAHVRHWNAGHCVEAPVGEPGWVRARRLARGPLAPHARDAVSA